MENKIVALEEGSKFVGEEKQKLEKMLAEQQNIIKLALARILPRKGEVAFCQVTFIFELSFHNIYYDSKCVLLYSKSHILFHCRSTWVQ